jgi:hypothetical protein
MKNQKTVGVLGTAFLTLMLSAPLFAQGPEPARRQITAKINGQTVTIEVPPENAPTEANFNQYKNDLLIIMTAQKNTLIRMHLDGADIAGKLNSSMQEVQAMKYSDIPENYPGFPDLSALKTAVLGQQQVMTQAFANAGIRAAQFTPGDPFPETTYASYCPLSPQPPEVAFTSGLVKLIADQVYEISEDFCDQIQSILGVGGNFAIACIVTKIIQKVATAIDYPIQQCHIDTGVVAQSTAIFGRLEYIHDQLDYSITNDNSNKAMLSTQLTNAENHIVTNNNNNKAALSSQLDTFKTITTRMAVEANMAEDPAVFVAAGLFETPASQGGYLELARQVLIDTYNAHVAAAGPGVVIYNPANELSLGATFTAQGKYREAYFYYRRGYRNVVKFP